MSTRSEGLQWFRTHYGRVAGPVYTSKLYAADESWTKTQVWLVQVPVRHVTSSNEPHIHLLCQKTHNGTSFHYLKVPTAFFREHLPQLGFTTDKIINLHLSAEAHNLFEDERGKGKVTFRPFLVPDEKTTLSKWLGGLLR
jgi:hypothetical protein